MTPKQRQAKIASIEAILKATDFKQDTYGNWKNTLAGRQYRAKLKKINLRLERKCANRWISFMSEPISSFDITKLITWTAQFISK